MATVLSRRFNTGALPLCLAAMDGCWVYVVSWLLVTQALHKVAILPVPSFLVLALLELLSMWLASRLFDKTDLSDTVIQVISGVVGLAVSVLLVFVYSPPESGGIDGRWIGGAAVSVVICLVLWFLGGYRATEPPSFNQAYAMFRIGLIVIGLCASLVAVLARKDSPQIWGNVGGVALWFFAFSLAALALGNREVVREESGSTGGGSWGVVLLLSVAGIVLLGSLGGAFGTSGILDVLRTILAVLILIVGFMAYAIGFIFILYEAIFNPEVKHEKPRIPTPEDAYSISGRFGLQFDQTPKFLSDVTGIPPNVITPVLWAIGVLAVVLFVWLVGRSLRRANRVVRDEASEEREHLGSWALFVQQVRNRLISQ